jgi:hypothetical protein
MEERRRIVCTISLMLASSNVFTRTVDSQNALSVEKYKMTGMEKSAPPTA